jgi:hypothetical protein
MLLAERLGDTEKASMEPLWQDMLESVATA